MDIITLRKLADREEIDYQFIVSALKDYANPRNKISAWLKAKKLIRIKKGLYIFGQDVALSPYSSQVLANLIYGPSAISLLSALSYYGLIPERVEVVTSITNSRNKIFNTEIGVFKYFYLHPKKYPVGIVLNSGMFSQSFLIATPEKALCDQIYIVQREDLWINNVGLEKYLFQDLRLDETMFLNFKLSMLREICEVYDHPNLRLLYDYLKRRKNNA